MRLNEWLKQPAAASPRLMPEWWDKWCWTAVVMIVWGTGWAIFGSIPFARGFQLGMILFWAQMISHRAVIYYKNEIIRVREEISAIDSVTIERQKRTIASMERRLTEREGWG